MKKRFGVGVILLIGLVLALSVLAARLPTVNSDNNDWGNQLNAYLQVAHTSDGSIKSDYVSSAMIVDRTIAAEDLGTRILNATHVSTASINNTHLVPGQSYNVSGLQVGNSSQVANSARNITGIFINTTTIDIGTVLAGQCSLINMSMPGLTANNPCFVSAFGLDLNTTGTGNSSLTFFGTNSSQGNGTFRVCSVNGTINPANTSFSLMCVSHG